LALLLLNNFPFLAGFVLFLSFMTKGPVGLFVLVYPAIHGFLNGKGLIEILRAYLYLLLGFSIPLFFLLAFEDFRIYLWRFLEGQIFAGVMGKTEIAPTRFYLILRLAIETLPLTLLLILRLSFLQVVVFTEGFWLSLALAISSSLPFVLSLKQMTFYMVPSLPFFSIALSELGQFWKIEEKLEKSKHLLPLIFALLFLNFFLAFTSKNRILSKNAFYRDLALNPPPIGRMHMEVGVCPERLYSDWETVAIAQRYLRWSFHLNWLKYTLVDLKNCKDIPKNCTKVYPSNPEGFALFVCKP